MLPTRPRSAAAELGDGRTMVGGNFLDHAFVRGLEVVGEPAVLTSVDSSDHRPLSFAVRLADR